MANIVEQIELAASNAKKTASRETKVETIADKIELAAANAKTAAQEAGTANPDKYKYAGSNALDKIMADLEYKYWDSRLYNSGDTNEEARQKRDDALQKLEGVTAALNEPSSKTQDQKNSEAVGLNLLGGLNDAGDALGQTLKTGAEFFKDHSITGKYWAPTVIEALDKMHEGAEYQRKVSAEANEQADEAVQVINQWVTRPTAAAVPNAVLALMTGGTSQAAQLGAQSTGFVGQISTQLLKNPQFYASAVQIYGPTYYEALDSGATEEQAMWTALLNSALGSTIEVGLTPDAGGLEGYLKNDTKTLLNFVKSSIEEGAEEVLQGVLDRLLQKTVGGNEDIKWSSTDPNEQAVLNPATSAQEFIGGVIVGGVLGGPTQIYNSIVNNANKSKADGSFDYTANVLQSAQEAGVSVEKAEEVARFAEASKTPTFFVKELKSPLGSGITINGLMKDGVAFLASNSQKAERTVQVHEYIHSVERTSEYAQLVNVVSQSDFIKRVGGMENAIEVFRQSTSQEYGMTYTPEEAQAEIVANWAEENLFQTEESVALLKNRMGNFLKRLAAKGDYRRQYANATAEGRQVLDAERSAAEAMRARKPITAEQIREVVERVQSGDASGGQYRISEKFLNQIDSWDKKTTGFSFVVGETSEALQKAGVPKKQIRWDATKIVDTLKKHDSGMDIDTIKQVPQVLENPVVVVDSKTVAGRKVVLGEVYDNNGHLVVVALELNPTSKSGKSEYVNIIKIATSQGRSHIQSLLDGTIRYTDPNENRVQNWLNANRLQLPLRSTNMNSTNPTIAQKPQGVNTQSAQNGEEYSVGGKSLEELLAPYIEKYGGMKLPNREIDVPVAVDDSGQKVSQAASTYLNATDDQRMVQDTAEYILKGAYNYTPTSIKTAETEAGAYIGKQGYENMAQRVAEDAEEDISAGNEFSFKRFVRYKTLLKMAIDAGDYETAQNCQVAMFKMVSDSAKIMRFQLDVLLKGVDGKRQAQITKRNVEKLNKDIAEKATKERGKVPQETIEQVRQQRDEAQAEGDKKAVKKFNTQLQKLGAGVTVAPELMNALENAQTQEDIDLAKANIYQHIADQLPPTKYEQFMSWRYLSMLFNPKTWIKNEVGNLSNLGLHKLDDLVAYAYQRLFLKEGDHIVAIGWQHTDLGKMIESKVKAAADTAAEREGSHKYDDVQGQIEERRRTFNNGLLEKTSGVLDTALNEGGITAVTGGRVKIGAGDRPMFKRNYIDALGNFMVARGLTEVTAEADAWATKVAQDYVFHTQNAAAQALTKLRNSGKLGKVAVDSLMPFIRTPANVLAQGLQRSPVGFAVAGTKLIKAAITQKSGRGSVSPELINNMARSTTGAVLFTLGVIASAIGLATGKEEGEDAKERTAGELEGAQDLSIDILGTKISFDWLEPASYPFLIGVLMNDGYESDDWAGSLLDAASAGYSQVFDMSMLSGLLDAFTSNYGDGSQQVAQAVAAVFENAATQSIPTLVGQLARTVDPVRRKTTSGESWVTDTFGDNFASDTISTVLARIPWASTTLEAERDVWGNEVGRAGDADNAGLNAVQQFLSPAALKQTTAYEDDYVTQIVLELYESTGQGKVIPAEVKAKDFKEKLADEGLADKYSSEVYQKVREDVGQAQWEAIYELATSGKLIELTETYETDTGKEKRRTYKKRFDDMTDEEKVKAISKVASDAKESIFEEIIEDMEKRGNGQ